MQEVSETYTANARCGVQHADRPESRCAALLMQAPAAIAAFQGPEHVFELVNDRFAALLSRSQAELVGRALREALPALAAGPLGALLDRVYATGEPFSAPELELSCSGDAQPVRSSLSVEAARDARGEVSGVMLVALELPTARDRGPSEERYERLLDSVQDMIFTKRRDSVVTYANRAASEHYGIRKEELRGIKDASFNNEDFTEAYQRDDQQVFETGKPVENPEEHNVRHDGSVRIFHTIKTPVLDATGKVAEIVGVSRDITEQKRMEREAVENERRLALALEAGQFGVWEWAIKQGSVSWSTAVERMHGLAPGSFEGTFKAYQRDIHPADRERVLGTIQRTLQDRQDHNLLYRIVLPEGRVRWLEAFGRLVLDDKRQPERMVGVCRDVTERIEADAMRTALAAEQARRQESEEARSRMQRILEGITDSFTVYDRDWRITFANHESTRPLGVTPEEVIGKSAWDLSPELVGSSFHRELVHAMHEQVTRSFTDYWAPADRWLEVSVYPLGELGLAVYARDITALKREELLRARLRRYGELRLDVSAALAKSDEPAEMMLESCDALVRHADLLAVAVWFVDASEVSLELMAAAGECAVREHMGLRLALSNSKLGSIACGGALHVTSEPCQQELIGTQLAAGKRLVSLLACPLVVGSRVIGLLTAYVSGNPPEELVPTLASLADAMAQGVERRRAELELAQRASELARSNADLEQFAYVASHDLQEPLRMVASYVQLLARRYKGKLDQDADEFIAFTVEGATRMQRLINDLLSYSRLGTRGQNLEDVPIAMVLGDVETNLAQIIEESGAKISYGPMPTVAADRVQLLQLFQNLIGNALKFRRAEAPRVQVTARREQDEWLFTVKDNGVGIESEYFERIFVIFQRLNTREHYPGTGIGLAIAKKIVERHGGRIWVESQPGQGTTFSFTLSANLQRTRRLS